MQTENFTAKDSIVRRIWGKSDTILLIFAGAAAEFALNKAVDWLYFTGRLPADPIGRLFSTMAYARTIIFSEKQAALRSIAAIAAIHKGVEEQRAATIPDWAYRDVLFMLVHYSVAAFETLERPMAEAEKQEVFDVFLRVGTRMGLQGLPEDFKNYKVMRQQHLRDNLLRSTYTDDLFRQYRKHLGPVRYRVLREAQLLVVPQQVRSQLGFRSYSLLRPLLGVYKISRYVGADSVLKMLIQPVRYRGQISELDDPDSKRAKKKCPFSWKK